MELRELPSLGPPALAVLLSEVRASVGWFPKRFRSYPQYEQRVPASHR